MRKESQRVRRACAAAWTSSTNSSVEIRCFAPPAPPYDLECPQAWILAAEQFCQSIDEQDLSAENINRAKRAVVIAGLIKSQVKASVAVAKVNAVSKAAGYKDFEVLGCQARAWAEQTKGNNWVYFAPPFFARPELEVWEDSKHWLRMLAGYAEASISYANALKSN